MVVGGIAQFIFGSATGGATSQGQIQFAPTLAGKVSSATGTISYGAFTANCLDIVGGGTVAGQQYVRIQDILAVGAAPSFPGSNGSIESCGTGAELRIYARDVGNTTNSQIIYCPAGLSGKYFVFFDSAGGLGDYFLFDAGAGQVGVFDTWGEISGAGTAANGRGRLGLCGTTNSAAYLGGGGIFNNTGGWQRETANGQGMFYSAGATPQVYNICPGGAGALNLVVQFPGCGSFAVDANGSVHGLAFPASSDERLKRNISTIESDEALGIILKLRPVRFKWSRRAINMGRVHAKEARRYRTGFVAQEVEDHLPEVIDRWTHPENEATPGDDGDGDEFRGIDYSRIVPILVGAVQELEARVKELEAA